MLSRQEGGGGVCEMFFGEEGYGHINGETSGRRTAGKQRHGTVLASNRQPWDFKCPMGARLEATHDRGVGSQPEERHGHAAEVLRIIRRRKNLVRGVSGKIFPYPPSFEERRLDPCVLPIPRPLS
jgi:hypothetical protein